MKGFHLDDEGYVYWNGKKISDSKYKKPPRLPKAGDIIVNKDGDVIGVTDGSFPSSSVVSSHGPNKIAWDRDSGRWEVDSKEIKVDIKELKARVEEIQSEISRLESTKIDKPSVSQELKDAEAYIDDYMAIAKKNRERTYARRQRIKKKLGRIKEANKETKSSNWKTILLLLGMVVAVLTVIFGGVL